MLRLVSQRSAVSINLLDTYGCHKRSYKHCKNMRKLHAIINEIVLLSLVSQKVLFQTDFLKLGEYHERRHMH